MRQYIYNDGGWRNIKCILGQRKKANRKKFDASILVEKKNLLVFLGNEMINNIICSAFIHNYNLSLFNKLNAPSKVNEIKPSPGFEQHR